MMPTNHAGTNAGTTACPSIRRRRPLLPTDGSHVWHGNTTSPFKFPRSSSFSVINIVSSSSTVHRGSLIMCLLPSLFPPICQLLTSFPLLDLVALSQAAYAYFNSLSFLSCYPTVAHHLTAYHIAAQPHKHIRSCLLSVQYCIREEK